MPNDKPASKQFSDLRQRAERALQERRSDYLESTELSKEEMHSLIYELQVHQIELEMQNDELRRLHDEIEESRNTYSHLYDFAPVGYFTVKKKGMIEQINLTGAALLGLDRQSLIGKPLTDFIAREDQDTFYLHHLQMLKTNGNHTCEIKMMKFDKTPFYASCRHR